MPQTKDFLRQTRRVPLKGFRQFVFRFSRSVRLVLQADLSSSCSSSIPAGPLRSTGVTPLHRYYGPVRIPARPTGRLWIPSRRSGNDPGVSGLSGSWLILRNVPSPFTPGSPADALAYCFSASIRLHHFREAGHCHLRCNEAHSGVRLRYGPSLRRPRREYHLFARSRGPATLPARRCRPTTGRDYMSNRQFTWQPPPRLLDQSDFPDAPENTEERTGG